MSILVFSYIDYYFRAPIGARDNAISLLLFLPTLLVLLFYFRVTRESFLKEPYIKKRNFRYIIAAENQGLRNLRKSRF
jgi:hypothetical protein